MKNKFTFSSVLIIILITIQACSLGSSAQPTKIIQEATLAEELTVSTAISVPTQEAGGVADNPGPETIDLANPDLYLTSSTPAYTFDVTMKYAGVGSTGALKEVTLAISEGTQSLPQIARHFLVVVTGGEGSAETVILGDQVYSVFQGTCYPSTSSSTEEQNASAGMPVLRELIKGQAVRVESGIEINGFMTDKYELTSENMVENDELTSSFVYVTRDGGFITRFEAQVKTKTDFQRFDINQFTDMSIVHNYIPVIDGSLVIAIPSVCTN
jgi:hypothetical protein